MIRVTGVQAWTELFARIRAKAFQPDFTFVQDSEELSLVIRPDGDPVQRVILHRSLETASGAVPLGSEPVMFAPAADEETILRVTPERLRAFLGDVPVCPLYAGEEDPADVWLIPARVNGKETRLKVIREDGETEVGGAYRTAASDNRGVWRDLQPLAPGERVECLTEDGQKLGEFIWTEETKLHWETVSGKLRVRFELRDRLGHGVFTPDAVC